MRESARMTSKEKGDEKQTENRDGSRSGLFDVMSVEKLDGAIDGEDHRTRG